MTAPVVASTATQFWVYTDIFPMETWLVAGGMMLVVSGGFYLTQIHLKSSPFVGLAATYLLLLQIESDVVVTSRLSAKVVFLFASFMTYLIYTYYTCDLTAR